MAEVSRVLPVLALLDVMLPGLSGIDLARRLRADVRTRELPIILVTARGEEQDRVRGLELGADDYVTKPFSPKELVARIRAVLRRRTPHKSEQPLTVGPLHLDPLAHAITLEGRELAVGPTEYQLLQFLMANPNRVYSRDQLLNALRGDHAYLEDRTVDVYIRRVRAVLGPEHQEMVQTVRGVGYKLQRPAAT
jgi:two-component system phosphate regulon response regulator PhoB